MFPTRKKGSKKLEKANALDEWEFSGEKVSGAGFSIDQNGGGKSRKSSGDPAMHFPSNQS